MTGCQVQDHSFVDLLFHQGQDPGRCEGLSEWDWGAIRLHQVHSACAAAVGRGHGLLQPSADA